MPQEIKEHIYYIRGMHCASCEVLIEKKLLTFNNIRSAEASLGKGTIVVEYIHDLPNIGKINQIFERFGYTFFNHPPENRKENESEESSGGLLNYLIPIIIVVFLFYFLPKTRLASLISVSSSSSLAAFFAFGLLAGLSSCAALVGGLVLSMSKQWNELHSNEDALSKKFQPHFLFNTGRIISYALLGGLLGLIGSSLKLSASFSSVLVILVSILMVALALQMLGVKTFQKFQISAPKFITRYAADETHFKGKYMPSIMGALTFFLPCGFTITAQSLALLSGSPIQGTLIMLFFALGTLPMLLVIGFSSVKFLSKPEHSTQFLKIAGVLVLFFALFNINSQLNLLGFSSISDIKKNNSPAQTSGAQAADLPPVIGGKQIVKMDASSYGYSPNYLKVKAGVPVRWEITDKGAGGCTNAIISRSLFTGTIDLNPGETAVKEFTPKTPGKYKFSCWMGMVSGTMEVI